MCWKTLLHWFINNKLIPDRVRIPHPEEPINLLATFQNIDIEQVRQKWLTDWRVPIQYHAFWQDVRIILVENLTVIINGKLEKVPEVTYAEEKRMSIDPKWANGGIVAHGMAHVSYSLLSLEEKAKFVNAYKEALATDALLKLLYAEKTYMQSNSVEAFADIYRFLGIAMPKSLRGFYLKLL